jgi:hypothetical protein
LAPAEGLVLGSVSSPITRRVYNLGLEPRFNKATVGAWRVALEARGLGSISINVRITAVRKLAIEGADNGPLAPELAICSNHGVFSFCSPLSYTSITVLKKNNLM